MSMVTLIELAILWIVIMVVASLLSYAVYKIGQGIVNSPIEPPRVQHIREMNERFKAMTKE